ncbi:MAG: hypothetical protein WBE72_13940 [Terracidiphilus sp.]
MFAVEGYQRPGVAMYWDRSSDMGVTSNMKVTVINKGNLHLHKCGFTIIVDYNAIEQSSPKFISDFELGPHEAKEWNFSPDDLGLNGHEELVEPWGFGDCLYYGVFGVQEAVDFHVYN